MSKRPAPDNGGKPGGPQTRLKKRLRLDAPALSDTVYDEDWSEDQEKMLLANMHDNEAGVWVLCDYTYGILPPDIFPKNLAPDTFEVESKFLSKVSLEKLSSLIRLAPFSQRESQKECLRLLQWAMRKIVHRRLRDNDFDVEEFKEPADAELCKVILHRNKIVSLYKKVKIMKLNDFVKKVETKLAEWSIHSDFLIKGLSAIEESDYGRKNKADAFFSYADMTMIERLWLRYIATPTGESKYPTANKNAKDPMPYTASTGVKQKGLALKREWFRAKHKAQRLQEEAEDSADAEPEEQAEESAREGSLQPDEEVWKPEVLPQSTHLWEDVEPPVRSSQRGSSQDVEMIAGKTAEKQDLRPKKKSSKDSAAEKGLSQEERLTGNRSASSRLVDSQTHSQVRNHEESTLLGTATSSPEKGVSTNNEQAGSTKLLVLDASTSFPKHHASTNTQGEGSKPLGLPEKRSPNVEPSASTHELTLEQKLEMLTAEPVLQVNAKDQPDPIVAKQWSYIAGVTKVGVVNPVLLEHPPPNRIRLLEGNNTDRNKRFSMHREQERARFAILDWEAAGLKKKEWWLRKEKGDVEEGEVGE